VTIVRDEGAVTQRAVPGPALYSVSALPERPSAIVGIVHGYADHAARYGHVMDVFAERGIGAIAIDLRGHGRATGARGYCTRFDEFLDDASELARLVADRGRGAPSFLLGHSFGGLVSATSALDTPRAWKGVLLSAPYLELALRVPAAKLALGRLASRIVPKLALPTGIEGKDLTHDTARARSYDEDPLVFPNARARWFRETQKAQERLLERASSFTLPLYMVFGTEDPVAKMATGRQFFEAAGSADKTWDAREGLLHEVLNELSWRDIANTMADWILARAKA
jgi:alpha-beta hydrolase superfamily lysophospholipase